MNYQEYFDSLVIGIDPKDARKAITILEEQADNPLVKEYNGLEEMVFELMLSLWNVNDYAGLEGFQRMLSKLYPDVYEQEKGQLLSILLTWYLQQKDVPKATEAWREWYNSDYDYDLILKGIEYLILYQQPDLLDEFIVKEYHKVNTSKKLIPGAAYILTLYKLYIEVGRLFNGESTLAGLEQKLGDLGLELDSTFRTVIQEGDAPLSVAMFSSKRDAFIRGVAYRAQRFIQKQYGVPFLSSSHLLDVYWAFISKSRSSNYRFYFKLNEEKFTSELMEYANERSVGVESALGLVRLLPLLFQALVEQGVFNQKEADKESAKAASIAERLARKFPEHFEQAGYLGLYGDADK